jgi:general secretion pathway protein G
MKRMKKGFTLIELILVMVILAILAAAVMPIMNANRVQAQQAKIRADFDAIKSACFIYRADTGVWPATLGALTAAGGVAGYNGPYLDNAAPADPCGTAYAYVAGAPSTIGLGAASTCPATTALQIHP